MVEGRRGWVSAEDPTGAWWVLHVYEDGWVELPGKARDLADTRRQMRYLLPRLGAVLALAAAAIVTSRYEVPVLPSVLGLAFFVLLMVTWVQMRRFRWRDIQQRAADREQNRAVRESGRVLRPREGAKLFRRWRSSADAEATMHGVRRVDIATVSRVDLAVPPDDAQPVVVTVLLHDGRQLAYRTPDRTAVRLFGPWTLGPVPG